MSQLAAVKVRAVVGATVTSGLSELMASVTSPEGCERSATDNVPVAPSVTEQRRGRDRHSQARRHAGERVDDHGELGSDSRFARRRGEAVAHEIQVREGRGERVEDVEVKRSEVIALEIQPI